MLHVKILKLFQSIYFVDYDTAFHGLLTLTTTIHNFFLADVLRLVLFIT